MTNCPNCGAPITGQVCEYCRTVFEQRPDPRLYVRENECVKQMMAIENLYEEALAAMRAYGHGFFTPNEIRRRFL